MRIVQNTAYGDEPKVISGDLRSFSYQQSSWLVKLMQDNLLKRLIAL
jgi:hypothetical protein